MNEMRVEKWWNEIYDKGKREKLLEKPTYTPFRLLGNSLGVTKTRTRDPSGTRRASNPEVFNPRPAGRMRPSGEFCKTREGYFTKYNA